MFWIPIRLILSLGKSRGTFRILVYQRLTCILGKTAVFVLSTLQQIEPVDGVVDTLVLVHTREMAFQIAKEFERFKKHFPTEIVVAAVFGGVPEVEAIRSIKASPPHIVVGTPGRTKALLEKGVISLEKCSRLIFDECDSLLESTDMRKTVQDIYRFAPKDKQMMMFSATISNDMRKICRKFSKDAIEVYVDSESKLTLHGLLQHYAKLGEEDKSRKLSTLLDNLQFNQIVIFVKSVSRAKALYKVLVEAGFPTACMHSRMDQDARLDVYNKFKAYQSRILVSTDVFGRGVDIERVNVVVNYDMPKTSDDYLHRVGRAGRFGTKGLGISFVSTEEDLAILEDVQNRFEVKVTELPESVDPTLYSTLYPMYTHLTFISSIVIKTSDSNTTARFYFNYCMKFMIKHQECRLISIRIRPSSLDVSHIFLRYGKIHAQCGTARKALFRISYKLVAMKTLKSTRKVVIPAGVKVDVQGRTVTVTGPRGTLSRDFQHTQVSLSLVSRGKAINAELWHADKKKAACLRTVTAAIENMIKGVTLGFLYKMRLVYAHFPINVNIEKDGTMLEIRNFLGERIVRQVELMEGVTIERGETVKDELQLSGNDIDCVSQSAAKIHSSTLVKNKDIRKFLDGIYVSEKTTVVQVEN